MDLSNWLSSRIEEQLRLLLETKHLYQSVTIDRNHLLNQIVAHRIKQQRRTDGDKDEAKIDQALNGKWHAHDEISPQRPVAAADFPPSVAFLLRTIKSSCGTCKAIEPMNIKCAIDLTGDRDRRWAPVENQEEGQQDFVLVFQCQSCKSQPDAFLIRRRGLKLTLCGRSPMEHTPVPSFIPKSVQRYYSDAIVATHSGKVLAGLCYLRTLIEQYVRGVIEHSENKKPDQVLEFYNERLSNDFRQRFPSLKDWYGRLSDAIHSASESSALFEEGLEKIETHFKAIQVFEEAGETPLQSATDSEVDKPSG